MMEKQYATQFFSLLLDGIQDLCRTNLEFERFAEVTGYISVELDNVKKERYVLNEIVQSSGHLVSESFCTKAFTTQTDYEAPPSPSHQKLHRDGFSRNVYDMRISAQSSQSLRFPSRYPDQTNSDVSFQRTNQARCTTDMHQRQFSVPVGSSNSSPYESGSDYGGYTSKHRSRSHTKCTDGEYESNDSIIELDNDEDADVESSVEISRSRGNKTIQTNQFRNQYQDRVSMPSLLPDMNKRSNQVLQETSQSFTTSQGYEQPRSTSSQWQQIPQSSRSKHHSPSIGVRQEITPGAHRTWNDVDIKSKPESFPKAQKTTEEEIDIKPKIEPTTVASSFMDDDEVIDLDMFEDDLDSMSTTDDQCTQDSAAESVLPESSPQRLKTSGLNPSIRNVVKYAVNQFRRYHFLKSEIDIDLFTVPPERLDMLLCDFFKGVRKADGSEMNIQTLKNFQSHIDRYLREGGYPHSLVKDHKFQTSRDWIKKRFMVEGRGRRNPARHTPLSDNEVDILFQSQQLGPHSPDSLINTMWFLNTKFFGIRNLSEHFNLKWGDVVLEWDDQGMEYLVCPLKTIQQFSPKVFPNVEDPSRCFVTCYKEYADLRPGGGLDSDSFFYLCPQKSSHLCNKESAWYTLEQLSWNRLSFLWRKMVAAAGLPPDRKVKSNWNV